MCGHYYFTTRKLFQSKNVYYLIISYVAENSNSIFRNKVQQVYPFLHNYNLLNSVQSVEYCVFTKIMHIS